jgi:hypothetical protein
MTSEEYLARLTTPVADAAHGTYRAFADHGCRCQPCCVAFSAFRDAGKPGDIQHGTAAGYSTYGCRCDACTDAKRQSWSKYARRSKKARASA